MRVIRELEVSSGPLRGVVGWGKGGIFHHIYMFNWYIHFKTENNNVQYTVCNNNCITTIINHVHR
jgi:hypothetical protein